eukprot:scaffold116746_cov21-Phaeocystis_antarctica.AAC.1
MHALDGALRRVGPLWPRAESALAGFGVQALCVAYGGMSLALGLGLGLGLGSGLGLGLGIGCVWPTAA